LVKSTANGDLGRAGEERKMHGYRKTGGSYQAREGLVMVRLGKQNGFEKFLKGIRSSKRNYRKVNSLIGEYRLKTRKDNLPEGGGTVKAFRRIETHNKGQWVFTNGWPRMRKVKEKDGNSGSDPTTRGKCKEPG